MHGFFGNTRQFEEGAKMKCGGERKFIVLKIPDINEALNGDEIEQLTRLCEAIADHRKKAGKTTENEYAVINTDEPYFPVIKRIMEAYGHWGDGDREWLNRARYRLDNDPVFRRVTQELSYLMDYPECAVDDIILAAKTAAQLRRERSCRPIA